MADTQEVSFQYANECDLEIHCSPFGLSGLYIKVKGTNIMGIGSTMGLVTGSTTGLIHYNDANDLMDQKYKLYVIVDEEGNLRIDFTKIFTLKHLNSVSANINIESNVSSSSVDNSHANNNTSSSSATGSISTSAVGDGISEEKSGNNLLSPENSSSVSSGQPSSNEPQLNTFTPDNNSPRENINKPQLGNIDIESYEEDEVPTLVFKGKCPEGRPDNIDPFIGIFSFERED